MLYKKFTSFDGKIFKCGKNMLEVQHMSVLRNSFCPDPDSDFGRIRIQWMWIRNAGGNTIKM